MGFFSSWDVKDKGSNPYLEQLIGNLANFSPGGGMGRKLDRQFLRKFSAGGDVSDYGQLASVRQLHAGQARSIADEYTSGANQLVANAGGEQANLLQRQKEIALEHNRESEGMESQQALTSLYDSANERLQRYRQGDKQMQLGAMQGAANAQGDYYNSRYNLVQNQGWGNQLAGIIGSVTGGAGALLGGLGKRP